MAVLLISADFIASDFIAENELPPLLAAAEEDGVKILSLILSPSRYEKIDSLSKYQSVNPPSKPLIGLPKVEQEEYLVKLSDDVLRAVDEAHTKPAGASGEGRPRMFNLPFSRNEFFTGRDDILKGVHESFNAGEMVDVASIPEEIFSEGAKELGEALAAAAESPLALTEAIGEAARFSLLQRHPKARMLSLHRLVQAVLRDEMDGDARRMWVERVVRAVNKVFPTSDYLDWQLCSRLAPHALCLAEPIDELCLEFPEAARMLNQAGEYLNERAQYANAEPLFRRALAIREKAFGIEYASVASSLNNLAGLHYNLGKYAEAESIWKRALLAHPAV